MGFQTIKGLSFFFKKFETKYHNPLPFSFFSSLLFFFGCLKTFVVL